MKKVFDRIEQYPNRYQLQKIDNDVYDIIPQKGEIVQEGTPLNREFFNTINPNIECTHSKIDSVHVFTLKPNNAFINGTTNYTVIAILTNNILYGDTFEITDGETTYNGSMYYANGDKYDLEINAENQPLILFNVHIAGGSDAKAFFNNSDNLPIGSIVTVDKNKTSYLDFDERFKLLDGTPFTLNEYPGIEKFYSAEIGVNNRTYTTQSLYISSKSQMVYVNGLYYITSYNTAAGASQKKVTITSDFSSMTEYSLKDDYITHLLTANNYLFYTFNNLDTSYYSSGHTNLIALNIKIKDIVYFKGYYFAENVSGLYVRRSQNLTSWTTTTAEINNTNNKRHNLIVYKDKLFCFGASKVYITEDGITWNKYDCVGPSGGLTSPPSGVILAEDTLFGGYWCSSDGINWQYYGGPTGATGGFEVHDYVCGNFISYDIDTKSMDTFKFSKNLIEWFLARPSTVETNSYYVGTANGVFLFTHRSSITFRSDIAKLRFGSSYPTIFKPYKQFLKIKK